MEDLFALLDDKAGTERLFIVAFCKAICLYIIDSDTALLYQPSDLALGGGKPHLDHQIRQRNGSIGEVSSGKGGGRHIRAVARAAKELSGCGLRFLCLPSPCTILVSS